MSQDDPNAPQPYPAGSQPYPTGGQDYPGGGAPQGSLVVPQPVALAVKLMYVGAALSLVGVLVAFMFQDAMREQMLAQPNFSPADLDAAVAVVIGITVVFGLLGVGLWVLNAVFNAKGKNWARILSTVLGALAVLFTMISITQPAAAVSRLLSLVQVALAVVILFLLWRPESSRFYAAAKAPRY